MKYNIMVALAAGLLALVGAAHAQSPIVIQFSHVVAPDTPKGKAALKFKELAEKYTADKVKVKVYPNSSLYKDKEEIEALQLGAVQMLAPSVSKFGPIGIKQFEVFDLPFVVHDTAGLHRVTQGPVGRKLLNLLDAKGIIGLTYWDNGFKIMSANTPLHMPEDFQGLRMRVQSSRVLEAQMRALGAIPQVTALSEAFQALMTNNVNGTENTPSNEYTQRLYEVQKYLVVSNHGFLEYAVIVNKKFWQSLPANIRAQLDKAMAEATDYGNNIAQKENDDALEAMRKLGKTTITELTAPEEDAWRKALLPVYDELASRVGKDTIAEFVKAAGSQAN
jgi:C4-dicarboxylate-binding protein DctP